MADKQSLHDRITKKIRALVADRASSQGDMDALMRVAIRESLHSLRYRIGSNSHMQFMRDCGLIN